MADNSRLLRLSTRSITRGLVRDLERGKRHLHTEIREGVFDLGDEASRIARQSTIVPVGEDRMRQSIRAIPYVRPGGAVQVTLATDARNEKDGYDYTAVTRFGHRKKVIVPKQRRIASASAEGKRALLALHDPANRAHLMEMRPSVPGVRVSRDWADTLADSLEPTIEAAASRIGRSVRRRILRG